jgi:hypothetical protein
MQGHLGDNVRPFKPSSGGGGSKKGKPQWHWPWVLKAIADAIFERAKGSSDAWKTDRSARLSLAQFKDRMDDIAPGWEDYCSAVGGHRATPWAELLHNRVYKMHYSGTSDRGVGHSPETRACDSSEHLTKHYHVSSPMAKLHLAVVRGETRVDWKSFL